MNRGAAWLVPLALLACREAPPSPDTVARIDGRDIPHARFQGYLEAALDGLGHDPGPEAASALFDRFLEERLLDRLAAEEAGGAGGAGGGSRLQDLLAREVAEVGRDEILRRYEERARVGARPARVDLRQLLVTGPELAEQAVVRLRRGEPFESVAVSLTTDPGAAQAWMQNGVERSDLPEALAETVFGLAAGEVSEVVRVEHGYLVFQVAAVHPPERPALEAIEAEIVGELEREKLAEARRRLVDRAARRYHLQVFERNLPFPYRGRFSPREPS